MKSKTAIIEKWLQFFLPVTYRERSNLLAEKLKFGFKNDFIHNAYMQFPQNSHMIFFKTMIIIVALLVTLIITNIQQCCETIHLTT